MQKSIINVDGKGAFNVSHIEKELTIEKEFSALLHSQSNPNLSNHQKLSPNVGNSKAVSSSNSSGLFLCGDSVVDSGIDQCYKRIWKAVKGMLSKVWSTIKDLGVEGEEDDEVFEGIVRKIEARERNCFEAGKATTTIAPSI